MLCALFRQRQWWVCTSASVSYSCVTRLLAEALPRLMRSRVAGARPRVLFFSALFFRGGSATRPACSYFARVAEALPRFDRDPDCTSPRPIHVDRPCLQRCWSIVTFRQHRLCCDIPTVQFSIVTFRQYWSIVTFRHCSLYCDIPTVQSSSVTFRQCSPL